MSENVIEIRKCTKHVIIIHHHHHSQKVHKKNPNHTQPCCLPCLCPLRETPRFPNNVNITHKSEYST